MFTQVNTKTFVASVQSISQSDLYLTVKARLFTVPNANLNGCRCTEAFLDEIVENKEDYVGLPLSADVRNLCNGNYEKLGHMYDSKTGEFHSTMVGSFYDFEKETLKNGETALIGYARVMKRNKGVCAAICDLFASGNLSFSFQVSCGEYTELEDGTILIDASAKNKWEGQAIVWSPACPDAVALDLVAELVGLEKGDDDEMNEEIENIVAECNEDSECLNAETHTDEINAEEVVVAEDVISEETSEETAACGKKPKCADEEDAECKKKQAEEEEAECKKKAEEEDASCKKKAQEEDAACKKKAEEEDAACKKKAEEQDAACKKKAEEEEAECKKKRAEEEVAEDTTPTVESTAETETAAVMHSVDEVTIVETHRVATEMETPDMDLRLELSELRAMIASLKASIDEMKNAQTEKANEECAEIAAETIIAETETAEIMASTSENIMNPFIGEIESPVKYSLLEPEKTNTTFTLLDTY